MSREDRGPKGCPVSPLSTVTGGLRPRQQEHWSLPGEGQSTAFRKLYTTHRSSLELRPETSCSRRTLGMPPGRGQGSRWVPGLQAASGRPKPLAPGDPAAGPLPAPPEAPRPGPSLLGFQTSEPLTGVTLASCYLVSTTNRSHTPVAPGLWEAVVGRLQVRIQPEQLSEILSRILKNRKELEM